MGILFRGTPACFEFFLEPAVLTSGQNFFRGCGLSVDRQMARPDIAPECIKMDLWVDLPPCPAFAGFKLLLQRAVCFLSCLPAAVPVGDAQDFCLQ